ncbi:MULTISPECIES: DUF1992 domain-containing protein [unclassified Streptomyces]|uniref:DnaJ family domain-containing protein n=1 Tax=unclassified Streptomyces TaxID=2593676 RepID=UPI002E3453B8|nr:DUF1992 domain-containing protein [Streptomyces sp. NBC_01460]WSS31160.1 DUF1992 domain-containing protein [Streptomyces sp. NBC_01185]
MTERKPAGVSFETWVDRQIREAEERGSFADLPGAGRPIPGLDRPYDAMWWIKAKMEREGLSALPPSLALRKAAEDAREEAFRARSEAEVRRILTGINERIREALARPPEGPPLHLAPFDIDALVSEWHAGRHGR